MAVGRVTPRPASGDQLRDRLHPVTIEAFQEEFSTFKSTFVVLHQLDVSLVTTGHIFGGNQLSSVCSVAADCILACFCVLLDGDLC